MLRHLFAFFVLSLSLVYSRCTFAQYTWANASSGTWSTSGNWSPAGVPAVATVAQFGANPVSGNVITLTAASPAAAFIVTASRATSLSLSVVGSATTSLSLAGTSFTLTGASSATSNVALVNYAANPASQLIISTPVSLGASKTIVCAGGSTSLATGNIISLAGVLQASGATNFLGGGTWDGTNGNAGGILKLSAANNPLTGQLALGSATGTSNCGILELNTNNTLAASGVTVLVNSGSQIYINLPSATALNQFGMTLNGSGNNASGYGRGALRTASTNTATWGNGAGLLNITLASASVIYAGNTFTLNGGITGSGQLIKEGPGNLMLAGQNLTLTGGIKVSEGNVTITKNNSLLNLNDIILYQSTATAPSISLSASTSQTIGSLSSNFTATTGTIAQNVILGTTCTLTINQSSNTTFGRGAVNTLTSSITGTSSSNVVKTGSGTLTLTNGGHTFYGGLTITQGELRLAPSTNITLGTGANFCPVNLNGGTLSTIGIAATDTIYAGTLNILTGSTISLDATVTNMLRFSGLGSSSGLLTINGWRGLFDGTAGTYGRIFIGSSATLSAAQLAQIQFNDGGNIIPAKQLATGEIVPKVPITITAAGYGPFFTNASNAISVSYSTTASYLTGTFKVQLSDTTGAFSNYTSNIIGTGTTTLSGTISATIPSGVSPGSYRVRVVNTSPYSVGSDDNGSAILTLRALPYVTSINAYSGVAQGASVTLTGYNFDTSDYIYFGAVRTRPSSGNSNLLRVTVPYGASLGPVTLYDPTTKYAGNSVYPFVPAFDRSYFIADSLSFQPKVDYTTGTCPNIAVNADLDGDGLPELISINKKGRTLTIFQNLGTGVSGFSSGITLALQGNPSNVKVADIDGDGRPDIIAATGSGGSSIGIYRNLTNFSSATPRTLTFATRADIVISSVTQSPGVIAIADFDNDGRMDIAAACYITDPAILLVLRNTNTPGAGTVNSFALSSYTAGPNPIVSALTASLCVSDFNGDHFPDVAMVTQNGIASPGTLSVFRNNSTGPGITSFATPLSLSTGIYPLDVQAADMDGDGATDIVVTQSQSNSVSLFRNTTSVGASTFTFGTQQVISTALSNPAGIQVGDLDGDGKPEIVAANFIYTGTINVFKNTSTSGSPSFTNIGTLATGKFPAGISIGDLDNDGYPEIITGNTGNDTGITISVIRNTPVPTVGVISPASPVVCVGAVTTLAYSLSLPSGETGAWSSANAAIATVNALTGAVTGVSAGTVNISYTVTVTRGSISRSVVRAVSVSPLPVVALTGANTTCPGITVTLAGSPSGGTFTHINTVTSLSAVGGVTGVATAGKDTVSYAYISPVTGCANSDTQVITIVPLPVPGVVSGADSVCPYANITLSSSGDAGGRWISSSPSYASVDSLSGVVTGVTSGVVAISYSLTSSCGTYSSSKNVNVLPQTVPADISGPAVVCTGQQVTLSASIPGGVWSSTSAAAATVSSAGVVSGVAVGVPFISYTINGVCGSAGSGMAVTVNTVPSTPAGITGGSLLCIGRSLTLYNASAGGSWYSSSASVATIDAASGILNGITAGSTTVSYIVSNTCGTSAPATLSASVLALPVAQIVSASTPCVAHATNIVFSGTAGATIAYNVDGGSYYNLVLTGGSVSLNTGVISSGHSYILHSVDNGVCPATIDTSVTIIPQDMVWLGGTPGAEIAWGSLANWSCGTVPAVTDSVIIPAALHLPSVTGMATIKTLTIDSGAYIVLDSPASLLVSTTFTNNGAVIGSGSLIMAGSALQHIKGAGRVSNLDISNNTGATIDSGAHVIIASSLTLHAGVLKTNDSLELASADTSGSAYIAPIAGGASISGKVTTDQYIQGGYRRYRFWSHPFADTLSLSQLQPYIDITGLNGAANGFTTTTTNAPSAFRFDPRFGNDTMGYDPGWKAFTRINSSAQDTNTFHPGQGIRLFFRGKKGEGLGYLGAVGMYTPSSTVVKMAGKVNQGPTTIKLVKGSSNPDHQEFNMVGNPYPSPVDIGTILYNAKQSGNINGSAFYLWVPSLGAGGQYISVPLGTGAPEPYYLPAYSCFQVRAAHNGDSLNFIESNKHATADNYLFRKSSRFTVLNVYDTAGHLWDMLRLQFDSSATDANDNNLDAVKPMGSDFNFYIISSDNKRMSIDARPYSDRAVPLGVNSAYAQQFVIRADNICVPAGKSLVLHDKLLDTYTTLNAGSEYGFAITGNRATQGNNRLELLLKPAITESNKPTISVAPNPATNNVAINYAFAEEAATNIRVTDVSGVCLFNKGLGSTQRGTTTLELGGFAPGVYMVEITSATQKVTAKLVKE